MGRSGGGGGRSGGSRSSGGRSARSSSSRSSSSFGGSSRPSGGFGGGPRPAGGYGGGYRPYRPPHPHGPMYHRPAPRRGGHIGCGGLLTSIISLFIVVLLLVMVFSAMSGTGGGSYESGYTSGITKSTVVRDKLHGNASDAMGYYTDECDWIRNETTLVNGLKTFYDKTGILPYVYIIDNIEGDYDPPTEKLEQFAETKYSELFPDDEHLLLVFWDYGGAYEYTLWLGEDTTKLMDREACDILFDYLDYYYYAADTEDAFFAESFAQAGNRIMTVQRSFSYYLIRIAVVAAVVYGVYYFLKKRKEKAAEKKRRAEEILSTPLEKFGDGSTIDNLEKKYEKEI